MHVTLCHTTEHLKVSGSSSSCRLEASGGAARRLFASAARPFCGNTKADLSLISHHGSHFASCLSEPICLAVSHPLPRRLVRARTRIWGAAWRRGHVHPHTSRSGRWFVRGPTLRGKGEFRAHGCCYVSRGLLHSAVTAAALNHACATVDL